MLSVALKLVHAEYEVKEDIANFIKDTNHVEHILGKANKSGINFLRVYTFGQLSKPDSNYIAMAFPLMNPKRFEKFINHMLPPEKLHLQEDIRKFIKINDKTVIGWDHEVVMLYHSLDSLSGNEAIVALDSILVIDPKNSLFVNNENFRNADKLWAEAMLWLNMEEFTKIKPVEQLLQSNPFTKYKKFDENYFSGICKFNKGEITLETQYHIPKDQYKKNKDIFKGFINEETVYDAPVENPLAVLATGFEATALPQMIAEMQLMEKVEKACSFANTTPDELFQMFNGDMVLLLKDVRANLKIPDENNLTPKKRRYDYAIGVGIGNQEILDKIFKLFIESGLLKKEGDGYIFFDELFLIEKGHTLYFTNSEELHNDFKNGALFKDLTMTKLSQENSLLLYLNHLLPDKMQRIGENTEANKTADLWWNIASQIPMSTADIVMEDFDKNVLKGEMILSMKDKEANTLLVIYHLLKNVAIDILKK